jgi:Flp pilus assembly protein TadD
LSLNPDYAGAHCNLGVALAQTGRIPDALRHFEAALRIDPEDPNIRLSLGAVLRALGRTEESEAQVRRAERLKAEQSPIQP